MKNLKPVLRIQSTKSTKSLGKGFDDIQTIVKSAPSKEEEPMRENITLENSPPDDFDEVRSALDLSALL